MSQPLWNPELIAKYNINGPRYTSYPTALSLHEDFQAEQALTSLNRHQGELSLYIHIPYCAQLCYYCGCNKIVTRHQHKGDDYITRLALEMTHYTGPAADNRVTSIHLGGGTPTFLNEAQLKRLVGLVRTHFNVAESCEMSIEIDPRRCSLNKLACLRSLGFNRVSYGVQDFDEEVQQTINRIQSYEMVSRLVEHSRFLGFESINLDLVYGLPHQTPQRFKKSLDAVLKLNPDRISLFSYAHLPERFAAQRKIPEWALPDPATKLSLLQLGIETFTQAGYQFIGMDHFAKPHDELAIAQREGRLQRNFQGYTTHGQDAMLGLGASSISQIDGVMWQNAKEVRAYGEALEQNQLPVEKGYLPSRDDRIRAALISQLICHFQIDTQAFAQSWQLGDFWDYFAEAKSKLAPFIEDQLVVIDGQRIQVAESGRLWVRSICACFDAYLSTTQTQTVRYSKVV